jgi:cytochrome c nitrite reductase small subunit
MDFHEPIMITPRNSRTLQENCVRCHADFVHEIVRGSTTHEDAVKCVHCHRGAGHGARP